MLCNAADLSISDLTNAVSGLLCLRSSTNISCRGISTLCTSKRSAHHLALHLASGHEHVKTTGLGRRWRERWEACISATEDLDSFASISFSEAGLGLSPHERIGWHEPQQVHVVKCHPAVSACIRMPVYPVEDLACAI